MWSGYFKKDLGRPDGGSDDSPIDPERVDLKRSVVELEVEVEVVEEWLK
jgi:hypothetical protein